MNNKGYIVVLGAGESGVGSAILAQKQGFDVFVSDFGTIAEKYKKALIENNIEWEEKQHSMEKILAADEVIKSPGIPEKAPVVKELRAKGINIISEIEFAGRYTNAKTVCITGSNGKTTTTLLTYDLLKRAGLNVGLGGNVGKSFAWQVATENFDYYVLELSSFQLDGMYNFKADVAVLMNVTPDHLDRYEYKFENYLNSKFRIMQNMDKDCYFVYCQDDPATMEKMATICSKTNLVPFSLEKQVEVGACLSSDESQINIHLQNNDFIMNYNELSLPGKHNAYNSMAAAISAKVLGIKNEYIRESLTSFQGVEHRLEHVLKVHKIDFINDSKATNINSTWYALESMHQPTIWIVGGKDKGNDYTTLLPLVRQKVKAIICLGVDNTPIHKVFDGVIKDIIDTQSMEQAVKSAYFMGEEGDVVLLSPCCASFDLFENYEDRGRQFKAAVRNL
ncbi:MAG: UDP-N-acetylmuramoyl-L-alanine--D-glutamate ligase [Salinivirgaceae bacterium]|nr:UDP-N-acetylmuramoyl-L-alanine--D-glutamate ligase [Salinivirgaceae bacterium]